MQGTGYGVNIRLLETSQTYQARIAILLRRGGVETELFRSPNETVTTTHNFATSGPGVVADGIAGDQLIVRVSCAGGGRGIVFGQPQFMGVSINPSAQSFVDVPLTTIR